MPLGSRLRSRRQARGMTLTRVADETGLSVAYLSHVERGHRAIALPTLKALHRLYDTPHSAASLDLAEISEGHLAAQGIRLEEALAALIVNARPSQLPEWLRDLVPAKGGDDAKAAV